MKSKKTIWYGVRGREIVLPKGSELWKSYHTDRREKGFTYIAYFYKSQDGIPSYSPFISEKQAYQLGVI